MIALSNGDSINRTSQSADFITVLHGDAIDATEQRLRDRVAWFTAEAGLVFACASARSHDPLERIEYVYLRADEALTTEKDSFVSHEAAA
ncbi:MAG: hypothetical protein ABIR62_11580 [Dokdonella sp.]|uniref:hypothetical protein n=1 Tax=Dokdonella sp. TaxID=2291710 RepID=UPI0032654239